MFQHFKSSKSKIFLLIILLLACYLILFWGLWFSWYSNFPLVGFHFFNDWKEWLQMDKVGHLFTAFHVSVFASRIYLKIHSDLKISATIGIICGILFQTPIEILDGFSVGWGASISDMVANVLGAILGGTFIIYNQPIFGFLKFSYSPSWISKLRPEIFGNTFSENVLKDYNGQTYWSVFDVKKMLRLKYWPPFINLAVGYGGQNMIGGENNLNTAFPNIERYRQVYISLDLNWYPKSKNKCLDILMYPINLVKIPFPAVEFNIYQGLRFHWIHF